MFLRPGLDVKLRVPKASCRWTGELRLSREKGCEQVEGPIKKGEKTKQSQPAWTKSYTNNTQIFRLASPARYAILQYPFNSQWPIESSHLQAPDFQLFFCVKPGPQFAFQPLHFFWYKRDADGMSARALLSSPIRGLFRGWAFLDAMLLEQPLAQDLQFRQCLKQRWSDFDQAKANAG